MVKWLICLVFLLLTGCFETGERIAQPSITPVEIPLNINIPSVELPVAKTIVLGFSQLGSESAWRAANTNSIKAAALEAGITLIMKNAQQSQQNQVEAIRSFIESKVDVIAIAPVVQTGWDDILEEAKQAGIPVIILDRAVNVKDHSLYVTCIGSDFFEEGVKAAKYMLDKMRNYSGRIKIAELQGTIGSTPSIDRGRGFRKMIKGQNTFDITLTQSADFTMAGGYKVMREFLSLPNDKWPKVLFSHNDDMAIGAVKAIEEAGLKPGTDIIIISVDGTRRAFEQMIAGNINAVVECNPLLGPLLMQATQEIMSGRTLPKRMVPPEDIFPQELAAMEVGNRTY
ncbi:ABC transporter substrate-binding protein [Paenibacillus gallinarum]|uniref:ABC transporter substrate-binding protein n=1 Tax=Paenibacillus gallinarum TaxID=2762232 RepID=UPI00296AF971|nr:ABC transporter substrate-binding protein [Paenibacillus gallinarum]